MHIGMTWTPRLGSLRTKINSKDLFPPPLLDKYICKGSRFSFRFRFQLNVDAIHLHHSNRSRSGTSQCGSCHLPYCAYSRPCLAVRCCWFLAGIVRCGVVIIHRAHVRRSCWFAAQLTEDMIYRWMAIYLNRGNGRVLLHTFNLKLYIRKRLRWFLRNTRHTAHRAISPARVATISKCASLATFDRRMNNSYTLYRHIVMYMDTYTI